MNIIFFNKISRKLFTKLIQPRSTNDSIARKELILNILLTGSIALAIIAICSAISLCFSLNCLHNDSTPTSIYQATLLTTIFFLILIYLLFLSKKGHIKLASYIFITLYLSAGLYSSFTWGIDTPQALLIYALVVIMSGALVSTTFSLQVTTIVTIMLTTIAKLQLNNTIKMASFWRQEMFGLNDVLVYTATLYIIALVVFLYNREIEKSLNQATLLAHALQKERNLLETKVIERTQELNQAQLEKIYQLYRFAELGRSTAGLFHDLVNPLTIASLNLARANHQKNNHQLQNLQKPMNKAYLALKRLENFIQAVQSNIKKQDIKIKFCLNKEIDNAKQILAYKAKKLKVTIIFVTKEKIIFYGNPHKFNQIITNMISNSIDAFYKSKKSPKYRVVKISLNKHQGQIVIKIQDNGCGILKKNLSKIYNPFFTTKKPEQGTGIGLTISKKIIEKDFKGQISCQSTIGKGSSFTIKLPINK